MIPVSEPITLPEIGSAIHAAAEEVFSVMLGMTVSAGEAQIPPATQEHTGVMAVLGLTGEWGGSGQVACDAALAVQIASRMLMADYDSVTDEVLDAVAEVANMIVGNVKTTLEQTLGPMGMSAPAVCFGAEFETRAVGNPNMVLVPFTSAGGQMSVQIAVAPAPPRRLKYLRTSG